jgi:uncharacterized Tic20 family protein
MPGGSDYSPPAPSSGAGYTPPAPSSGADYTPPSSGAGYTPPSSGAGYTAPPSSGAGYTAPPSSGAGYTAPPGGYAGHTYPSEQQAYQQQAYQQQAYQQQAYQQPGYNQQQQYGAQPPGAYGVQPGYGPQQNAYGTPPPPGYPTNDDKTYALIAHWGGVAGVFVGGGTLGWVGPLIAYTAKGNESPVVRAHAVTALNFHLTWAGAYVISLILGFATCGALLFVPFLVFLVPVIIGIIGSVKATNGEFYRYPVAIPLIK